jgi:hypothetical protein
MIAFLAQASRVPPRRTLGLIALVGLSWLGATGCGGDDLPRQPVSGVVDFEGQPLAKGHIQFLPGESVSPPIAAGAEIVAGKYAIARADGLVPGTYTVRISAEGEPPKKKARAPQPEAPGDMPGLGPLNNEELIPTKYNSQTTLTATVTKEGPNTFDYKLTK